MNHIKDTYTIRLSLRILLDVRAETPNGKAPLEHRNSFGSNQTSIVKLTTKPRINQGTSVFVIQ